MEQTGQLCGENRRTKAHEPCRYLIEARRCWTQSVQRPKHVHFGNIAPIVGCRHRPCKSTVISVGGDSRVVVIECLRGQSIDLFIGLLVLQQNRLHWYGHMLRKEDVD